MGLLDQVLGGGADGKSMSPLTKTLLALLAAKVATSYFGGGAKAGEAAPGGAAAPTPAPTASSGTIESGVLAGLPSLDSLLDHLRTSGLGDKLDSWVGTGDNKQVAPQELDKALGDKTVDELSKETGLPKESLLSELASVLPQVIDKLSPGGKLPGR